MPGAYAETLCRKLFIDQKLQKSMEEVGVAVEIGAGYDSRSLRFSLPFIELDFPQTMKDKEKMVEKIDPAFLNRIKMIGIDFDNENIPQVISRTQTENSLRVRCGKMWHLNEDYPYSDKRHGGT